MLLRRKSSLQESGTSGRTNARSNSFDSETMDSSRRPSSASAGRRPSGQGQFGFAIPDGVRPGEKVLVEGPDGRTIEVVLPPGCSPGQRLQVQVSEPPAGREEAGSGGSGGGATSRSGPSDGADGGALAGGTGSRAASKAAGQGADVGSGGASASSASNGRGHQRTLDELLEVVRSSADATRSSCEQLRHRLNDELQLQRTIWESIASAGPSQSSPQLDAAGELSITRMGAIEFSQTQAIVFAAAEVGDCKQLLGALAEARKFSTVLVSLEEAARNLGTAEEAMVTWKCLLDALKSQDRHEIEVWLEQARGLGLEVPNGVAEAIGELRRREEIQLQHFERCQEVEGKVRFALEAGDLELITQVVAEAEALGMKSKIVRQAAARIREHSQPSRHYERRHSSASSFSQDSTASSSYVPSTDKRRNSYPSTDRTEVDSGPSVRQLLEECKRLGLDIAGCTDREDLQKLLRNRRAQQQEQAAKAEREKAEREKQAAAAAAAPAPQGFKHTISRPAAQVRNDAGTVWSRQNPPVHCVSKRSQALWLLGLEGTVPQFGRIPPAELRSAYRRAAMECHPDRHQNHSREVEAKELFQKVKAAFDFLSNPPPGSGYF